MKETSDLYIKQDFDLKEALYNIVRLRHFAHEQLDKRKQSGVIFFDIKGAFDEIWLDGLIYKFHDMQLSLYINHPVYCILFRRPSMKIENVLYKPFIFGSGTHPRFTTNLSSIHNIYKRFNEHYSQARRTQTPCR